MSTETVEIAPSSAEMDEIADFIAEVAGTNNATIIAAYAVIAAGVVIGASLPAEAHEPIISGLSQNLREAISAGIRGASDAPSEVQ